MSIIQSKFFFGVPSTALFLSRHINHLECFSAAWILFIHYKNYYRLHDSCLGIFCVFWWNMSSYSSLIFTPIRHKFLTAHVPDNQFYREYIHDRESSTNYQDIAQCKLEGNLLATKEKEHTHLENRQALTKANRFIVSPVDVSFLMWYRTYCEAHRKTARILL